MSSDIEFKEFPLSYRLSQGSIFLAFFSCFATLKIPLAKMPGPARQAFVSLVLFVIVFGLIVSSYTVIRYPYLSLLSTEDYFLKVFPNSSSRLFKTCKILAIAVIAFVILTLSIDGLKPREIFPLLYLTAMLGFLIYLTFFYDPIEHPTIATFIRTTLGIGIVVFPIFVPILAIAMIRCQSLLDRADIDLD